MRRTGMSFQRTRMSADRLIHGESHFPPSLTLLTALVLLAIGVAAIVHMLLVES